MSVGHFSSSFFWFLFYRKKKKDNGDSILPSSLGSWLPCASPLELFELIDRMYELVVRRFCWNGRSDERFSILNLKFAIASALSSCGDKGQVKKQRKEYLYVAIPCHKRRL